MKSAAADSDLVRHPTSRAPIRSLASRDSANAWSWPSTLATCLRFTLQHRRRCVSIAFCSQLLSSFSPRGERSGNDTKVGRRWHNTANKKAGCTQEKKNRGKISMRSNDRKSWHIWKIQMMLGRPFRTIFFYRLLSNGLYWVAFVSMISHVFAAGEPVASFQACVWK